MENLKRNCIGIVVLFFSSFLFSQNEINTVILDSNIRMIKTQMRYLDSICWYNNSKLTNSYNTNIIHNDTILMQKLNALFSDTAHNLSLKQKIKKYKIRNNPNIFWARLISKDIYEIHSKKYSFDIVLMQSNSLVLEIWTKKTFVPDINCGINMEFYNTREFPDSYYFIKYVLPYFSSYFEFENNDNYIELRKLYLITNSK